MLYYADDGDERIHRVSRATTADDFGAGAVVEELSLSHEDGGYDRQGWLSPNLCRIYSVSRPTTTSKIYLASRKPR